jgi:hypothetical protein
LSLRSALLALTAVLLLMVMAVIASHPFNPFVDMNYTQMADTGLNVWAIHHELDTITAGQFDRLFQGNIFYPLSNPILLSEHLLSIVLFSLPLRILGAGPYLIHNTWVFLSYVFMAGGVYLLARELGLDGPSAFLVVLLVTFCEFRLAVNNSIQLITTQWIPFTLLFVHRYRRTRRQSEIWWAGLFFTLQGLTSGYWLIFFTLVVGTVVVVIGSRDRWWTDASIYRACLPPIAVYSIPIILAYYPYIKLHSRLGLSRSLYAQYFYGAEIQTLLGSSHTLFTSTLTGGLTTPEGYLSVGLLPLGLGVWWGWNRSASTDRWVVTDWLGRWSLFTALGAIVLFVVRPLILPLVSQWFPVTGHIEPTDFHKLYHMAIFTIPTWLVLGWIGTSRTVRSVFRHRHLRIYAAVGAVCFLVALGPVVRLFGIHLAVNPVPILLFYLMPGFSGLRAISRIAGLLPIITGLIAGFALLDLRQSIQPLRRTLLTGLIIGLALVEVFPAKAMPDDFNRSYAGTREVYHWLDVRGERGPVLEWPVHSPWTKEHEYVQNSMIHQFPLVNGYSGYQWEGHKKLTTIARDMSSDRTGRALEAFGVRYLIVHKRGNGYPDWADETIHEFNLIETFPGSRLYEHPDPSTRYLEASDLNLFQYVSRKSSRFSQPALTFLSQKRSYLTTRQRMIKGVLKTDRGETVPFEITVPPTLLEPGDRFPATVPSKPPAQASEPKVNRINFKD